jgi:outer membrane protein assembly factor BamB
MKTTNKTIGKIVAGCVLACCLTSNIQAQLDPGDTNSGSGGTNVYNPYGGFNPTPTITYPTNATLKWYLAIYNSPIYSLLSLAPDGSLYVPVGIDNGGGGSLISINTSAVDTNDLNYPAPDDFENWVYGVNAGPLYLTPVVATDGTVYSLNEAPADELIALNPGNVVSGTNAISWSFSGNRNASVPAMGNDGTVYFSTAGYVYAVTNAFGVMSSFTNTEGNIYYLTNASLKWVYNGGGDYSSPFALASMCLGQDGTVYVFNGKYSGVLYAFNPTNGLLKWRTSGIAASSSAYIMPAIGKDGTIYLPEWKYFCAVNPQSPVTGGIINYSWIYTNTLSGNFQYSPIIGADGTVYAEYFGYSGTTNRLYAINPNTGIPIWTNFIGSGITYYGNNFKHGSLATSSDGEIYLADSDGTLYSFAPDGTRNWSYSTGAQALGSPLIGPDGTLYVESIDEDQAGCYVYAFAIPSPVACSGWPEDGRNARRTAAVATASVGSPFATTNGFQFKMIGITNMPVCAFASSDLQIWTNIGQTLLTGGMTNFVDIGSTNYPYRFYRAMPQ